MFSIPTNVIRMGNNSLKLRQFTGDSIKWGMDEPWDHGNLETSKSADAQTCDGTNQNFDRTGEGDAKSGVQLVDRSRHSIRIDQESEVCEPGECVQG